MQDRLSPLSPEARAVMRLALAESEQLCGPPFLAKRAIYLADCYPHSREAAAVTPEHLLHGVLRDLEDPYGAQLGRRARKHLTQLGWTIGPANPARALPQAHDIDTIRLRSELDRIS